MCSLNQTLRSRPKQCLPIPLPEMLLINSHVGLLPQLRHLLQLSMLRLRRNSKSLRTKPGATDSLSTASDSTHSLSTVDNSKNSADFLKNNGLCTRSFWRSRPSSHRVAPRQLRKCSSVKVHAAHGCTRLDVRLLQTFSSQNTNNQIKTRLVNRNILCAYFLLRFFFLFSPFVVCFRLHRT